jgi:hypothetical protein
MFEFLGVDLKNLPAAMKVLEEDSQASSPISQQILAKARGWTYNKKTVDICERLLTKYNLPPFNSKFRFVNGVDIEIIEPKYVSLAP